MSSGQLWNYGGWPPPWELGDGQEPGLASIVDNTLVFYSDGWEEMPLNSFVKTHISKGQKCQLDCPFHVFLVYSDDAERRDLMF